MTDSEFEKYKLNHPMIDSQHKQIFTAMQAIINCYHGVYDGKVMAALIQEFRLLVESHFKYEKELMHLRFYNVHCEQDYFNHLLEHQYTISEINSFLLRQSVNFNEEFPLEFLTKVLINHVLGHDKKFTDWLAKTKV